jgi:hypothetical protein
VNVTLKLRVVAKFKVFAIIDDILNCVETAKQFVTSTLSENEYIEDFEKHVDRVSRLVRFAT